MLGVKLHHCEAAVAEASCRIERCANQKSMSPPFGADAVRVSLTCSISGIVAVPLKRDTQQLSLVSRDNWRRSDDS